VAASRCTTGTPICPAPRADRPMNYSRRRLEFLRATSWLDRAPDYPVGGIGSSGALQSSTFSLFLSLFSFALFWTDFIRSLALRQIGLAHKIIDLSVQSLPFHLVHLDLHYVLFGAQFASYTFAYTTC
jgi:hypothetical protein